MRILFVNNAQLYTKVLFQATPLISWNQLYMAVSM